MAGEVEVTALLFASYADAFGASEVKLLLPDGATVADAIGELRNKTPGAIPPQPLVAVNERYAGYDAALAQGDELAVIPPVAGG